MLLSKVLPIHIALRDRVIRVDGQRRVPNLNREPVLEIKQADLANILQLATSLAQLRLLVPRVSPRPPPEHRERPRADLALLIVHRPGLKSNRIRVRVTKSDQIRVRVWGGLPCERRGCRRGRTRR